MDDLVQAVVDEVLRRQGQRPALLVGRAPQQAPGWRFVTDGPYEAVILGSLTAAELLRFPDEASAQALLEGKPVYYRLQHTTDSLAKLSAFHFRFSTLSHSLLFGIFI